MEKFLKPVSSEIISDDLNTNESKFTVEKLERGFGNTIGTAMRRTILSSIPSSAPFAIELKGASHEFQGVAGIQEDVAEIILNLKELVIKTDTALIEEGEIYEGKLVSSSEGVVTAAEFELPVGMEVVNKDLVIANTTKAKALDLKIFIRYSKGFKTFEENRSIINDELGSNGQLIPMDSNFSPVVTVNFTIEEVNPGESYVYERLVLNVITKGNVEAKKVVAMAGAILRNHYAAFEEITKIDLTKVDDMFEVEQIVEEDDSQLTMTIEELNLTVRSQNGLEKADIKTVGELIDRPFSALKTIDNLGDKSVSEIVEVIQNLGLSFKSE